MIKSMGIDYSANFTGVVYDNILGNTDYWFTSNLKRDKNNTKCTYLDKDMNTVQKVDTICDNIFGIINESRPDIVVMESPAFMASNQNATFQDGYAIIKYVLRTMGINYILVPPVSLKLFSCGNARAEKQDVAIGLREYLDLPKGGVYNVTNLIESMGIIIVNFDYPNIKFDGVSFYNKKNNRRKKFYGDSLIESSSN